jgi:hypothetical protein
MADDLDYLLTLVRLCVLHALAGPEPEMRADGAISSTSGSG